MSGQADEHGNSSVQHAGLFDAVNVVVIEEMHDRRGTSGEFQYGNLQFTTAQVVTREGNRDRQQLILIAWSDSATVSEE